MEKDKNIFFAIYSYQQLKWALSMVGNDIYCNSNNFFDRNTYHKIKQLNKRLIKMRYKEMGKEFENMTIEELIQIILKQQKTIEELKGIRK